MSKVAGFRKANKVGDFVWASLKAKEFSTDNYNSKSDAVKIFRFITGSIPSSTFVQLKKLLKLYDKSSPQNYEDTISRFLEKNDASSN